MLTEYLILTPLIFVLIIAFLTKNIRNSLIVGIVSAALILNNFCISGTLKTILDKLNSILEIKNMASWENFWSSNNLFTLLFLLMLGIIITILEHSGSAFAYGKYIKQKLNSARSAECSSMLLSLFFFIDDYFSSITVGSVMQPVTDMFKIPRIKLGLLVNTFAAPMAIIIPISSWVATIMGQLRQTGISCAIDSKTAILCDPFFTYLKTIPFLFYAFIITISLWFIVLKRISYGILAKHEDCAQCTGNIFGGKELVSRAKQANQIENHSTMFDFVFPIGLLITISIFEILKDGGFSLLGGSHGLIEVLACSNIAAALFKGSLITVIITSTYFIFRKTIKITDMPRLVFEGIKMMSSSIVILVLIWTFSNILRFDLQIGQFIAQNLTGSISISFLPLIFFITAVTIATLIGTAWGSFGLLIPIGVPMLITLSQIPTPVDTAQIPMLFPLLGAIISGAVAGSHLSPISDLMFMSSTSSGCYHLDLVKAQSSVAIPAIISTTVAFLLVGLGIQQNYGMFISFIISILVGITLNFAILSCLNIINKRLKK